MNPGFRFLRAVLAVQVAALAIVTSAFCQSAGGTDSEAESLYQAGKARFDQSDFRGAIEDFTKAIQRNPAHFNAINARGLSRRRVNDLTGALEDFNAALKILPRDANLLINRASCRAAMQDSDGAIADLSRCIAAAPGNHRAFFDRAYYELFSGDPEAAVADFSEAIRLKPESNYLFERGVAYITMGRDLEAAEDMRQHIAQQPGDPFGHLYLWCCRSRQGDLAEATRQLGEFAVSYKPAPDLQWVESILNFLTGKSTEEELLANVGAGNTTRACLYAGWKRLVEGDAKGGRSLFRRGIESSVGASWGLVVLKSALEGDRGLFALDDETAFNVLDSVSYDPATGRIALAGHRDEAFPGPRIPWLDLLATLLESPKPEFTLSWTPESETAVDALFKRMNSPTEVRKIAGEWGKVFDESGRVTENGRWLLPLLGVHPVKWGRRCGWLGASMKSGLNEVTIESVVPHSPAARAGIQTGDQIFLINGHEVWHAEEAGRVIRQLGDGSILTLVGIFKSNPKDGKISLFAGGKDGSPWDSLDRYDTTALLLESSGLGAAANIVRACALEARLKNLSADQQNKVAFALYKATGTFDLWDSTLARIRAGDITQEQGGVIVGRAIMESIDKAFELKGTPVLNAFNAALKRGNAASSYTPAFAELDRQMALVLEGRLNALFARHETVDVPASMVQAACGVTPEVTPSFPGVDPLSQLARVMFEADYAAKWLLCAPALKSAVPRYLTEFEYARQHPEAGDAMTSRMRLWFTVDKLDFAVSESGNTLATRRAEVRINIREKGAGADAPKHPYGEFLTSMYREISAVLPAFHELEECAKLAGAARWLLEKKPGLRLPAEGRLAWIAPKKAPGPVFLSFSPKPKEGAPVAMMTAVGGVSLQIPLEPYPVDAGVVELRGLAHVPTLEPWTNEVLEKAARRPLALPPSPLRPGQVGRSRKGEEALAFLAEQGNRPGTDLEMRRKLDAATRAARRLLETQRAIDILTSRTPDRLEQYEVLSRDMATASDELRDAAMDLSTSLLFRGKGLVKAAFPRGLPREMLLEADNYGEAMETLQGFEGKLASFQEAWATLKGFKPEATLEEREAALANLEGKAKDLILELKPGQVGRSLGRVLRFGRLARKATGEIEDALAYAKGFVRLGEGYMRLRNLDADNDMVLTGTEALNKLRNEASDELEARLKDLGPVKRDR